MRTFLGKRLLKKKTGETGIVGYRDVRGGGFGDGAYLSNFVVRGTIGPFRQTGPPTQPVLHESVCYRWVFGRRREDERLGVEACLSLWGRIENLGSERTWTISCCSRRFCFVLVVVVEERVLKSAWPMLLTANFC